MENPGFAAPPVPRAHGAAYGVENPGFAAPPVPRADSAAYGVENPGYAALGSFEFQLFDGVLNLGRLYGVLNLGLFDRIFDDLFDHVGDLR